MENKFELFRLFSTPVLKGKLNIDNDNLLKIKNIFEKEKYVMNKTHSAERSKNIHILNKTKLKFLKNKIMNAFNIYKNDIFKYENTKMTMTTSWIARVKSNCVSDSHNHANSLFSGVYYINTNKNSGSITFNSFPTHKQIQPAPEDPTQFTLDNSGQYTFYPENDMILFFPSYVFHKIETNASEENRYSVAFNFMPYGRCGRGDSTIFLNNNFDIKPIE